MAGSKPSLEGWMDRVAGLPTIPMVPTYLLHVREVVLYILDGALHSQLTMYY